MAARATRRGPGAALTLVVGVALVAGPGATGTLAAQGPASGLEHWPEAPPAASLSDGGVGSAPREGVLRGGRSAGVPSRVRRPGQEATPGVRAGDVTMMVVGGVAGGAAGLFLGAAVGGWLGGGDEICGDSACGFEEAILGAMVGEMLGLPLGAHLANRGRGSLPLSMLTSVGSGLTGLVLLAAVGDSDAKALQVGMALAVPVGQLAAVIVTQRQTMGGVP